MIKEDDIILCNEELLRPRAISEDTILRNGGVWPEYAHTLMLCVDSFEQELAVGRLYSFCIEKPFFFHSLDQMILCTEEILDKANLEPAWFKPHDLEKERNQGERTGSRELKKRALAYPFEKLQPPKGKIASFYFRVYSRRNVSMQGFLAQCERGCKPNTFRSALELMHMLHRELGRKSIPEPEE